MAQVRSVFARSRYPNRVCSIPRFRVPRDQPASRRHRTPSLRAWKGILARRQSASLTSSLCLSANPATVRRRDDGVLRQKHFPSRHR